MSEQQIINWDLGADGILVLTLDAPGQAVNTMNDAYVDAMQDVVERLERERESLKGVVITSAKRSFFAGGDLELLRTVDRAGAAPFAAGIDRTKAQLRRLETLGVPVVAAINGAALGGGFELALACHRRIAWNDASVQLGLPEVQLGLLPGAGGVTRTVRMLGLVQALTKVLLKGDKMTPGKALKLGLIDEVVDTVDALIPAAKGWIVANPDPQQPWDRKQYRIPGGTPASPSLQQMLPSIPANLTKQLKGANYPAPRAILAAAVEGTQVDFDTALAIETRYLTQLVTGPVSKNMISALFFDLRAAQGSRGRLDEAPVVPVRKVVVLGAGMMGAAIAYVCARAGIEVVLKDVSQDAADRGKSYAARIEAKAVERGRRTQEQSGTLMARITPTTDPAAAGNADLVIEAVFEDPKVKAQVFAEIEPFLAPDALLGSNTSSLPISSLAEGVSRPEDFIGLHFFSPVDKMPLLEIVVGDRTSDAALHRALDLAKQIGKTPIVVNDSRGFFTSRVIGTFLDEGLALLGEGVPAASVEQASSQAGYPAPVLQLCDELNLGLMKKIRDETRAGTIADGREWITHPAEVVIDTMLGHGRAGRLAGQGFYDYAEQRRTELWPGLVAEFGMGAAEAVPFLDMQERMLFVEALESVRCLDEGVLESVADANIGSILGIGFPAWTGGVLQYINGYEGGPAGFVARARELEASYGARFAPPESLLALAAAGGRYTDERTGVIA